MEVATICVREVEHIAPGAPVREAAERMRDRGRGSLLVLNAEQEPIGIITDRDLALRVLAEGRDPDDTTVVEVMTPAPDPVLETASLEEVVAVMRRALCRRVPVVDRDGRLVGICAFDDVLRRMSADLASLGDLIRAQTERA